MNPAPTQPTAPNPRIRRIWLLALAVNCAVFAIYRIIPLIFHGPNLPHHDGPQYSPASRIELAKRLAESRRICPLDGIGAPSRTTMAISTPP